MTTEHLLEDVEQAFESTDFTFADLSVVRDRVYRATLSSGKLNGTDRVYIKRYSSNKQTEVREFADIATEVGHPPCQLGEAEHLYLLMACADGRPLSQILPVCTLPGLWWRYRDRLESAYRQLGTFLGELHTRTKNGNTPVLEDEKFTQVREHITHVKPRFNKSEISTLENILERTRTTTVPQTITYGDRSPHNIFYRRGSTTLIDSNCTRRGLTIDHASTLLGIRLMIRRLPYARTQHRISLEDAYWNGYRSTGLTPDNLHEAVDLRYLASALSMLEHYNTKATTLNSRITKRIDKPLVYREIRKTVESIQE